ncbi:MAG TPA: amino acid adenylation domain-containing protein, partial [Terriglobia bacterium]|nr:amino acid adenylation domain-containing protein [Terriglobia bacterium]
LKVDLLRQAFDAVVSRHWSLHTAIAVQESEPVQIIVKHEMAQLQLEEMSRIQERRSEEEFVRQEVEAIRRPFDLAQGPLLRASLLRLDDNRSILLMAIHPIISDKTSMRIVLRELADSYENLLAGRPPFLGGLPSQYVDFALWQRQWLQTEQSESHLRYWKRRLRDSHGLLELPTDRPRPAMQSFRCVRHSWSIPQSLYESVNDLSQRQGTPLFATLLALFQTLLLRCTGQEDIVVGISIEARRREEALDLIGPLVNWAALRTDLSGNPSFLELLERVREVIDGAYAHQEMPFEKLVEELQLERSLSHAPLFQVMFELQDEPQPTLALPDLKLSYLDIGPGRSEIDLTLSLVIDANGMSASFEYNTDLFDQTTIARLALHYQNLLEGIVANPGGRLADLPMLTERQRHQILVEWNENRTAYPEGTCIHQLFEDQVDRTPDKLAVQHGDRVLSYAELNRRANQLAHYLIGQGVKPEVLVGICALRSLEMVIGLIGILKAGGAYVPLDPAYPQDRLSFMLQDSGAEVLLTQESLLKRLPRHKGRIVCLDTLWESIAGESGQNIISKEDAENLAYVIYTSGSTGKPKGVAIQHRSSVAFLYWARGIFGPEQFAGILASTSICFDLSIFELFFPLCWGGKVILAENVLDLRSSPAIREVSLINTVPSAIAELVRVGDLPASVHTVNLAGEPLQNKLAQQIYRQSRARQVFNLYGPTEDTTYSTFAEVRRGADTSPSIGRPIDNTAVYLLDRHLHPVPVGIKGELYIGGSGLARGYLNHPDLTAEKFIPNPFGEQGGTRLYKTGDLARYLVDGNIEFLGRADKQVKLRGYRIELGEVETMLAGLPNVRESVVTVDDRELAEKCLVAYVVPERGQAPTSGELRRLLKEKLPEYMVPTTFFFLDALPLTPNGKVDRRALPRPQPKPELESSPAAPSTPTEEILAGIWSDVLRPRLFGIHEDFFDLGGHSLLAMRVMARIQEAFQVEIPLRMLFEAPTIEGLAVAVDAAMAKKVGSGRIKQGGFFSPEQQFSTSQIPAGPVPRKSKSPVPLSFAQQRLWFFDQLEPGKSTYHIPAVFRLAGLVQLTALEQSLGEIVRRHEVLRTVFRSVDGNPLQVVTPAQGLPFTVIDLEAIPESDRLAVCRQRVIGEVNRPFDLSKDYLLRASLLHLGQVEHILVLTLHHIAADGWSIAILLEELTTLYKAYSEGRPSPLEELPIQYADFALWQRERLQGVLLESELTYWTRQLQGTPSVLELPIDHIRTTTPSYRGARESIILTKDVADSL